MLIQAFQEQNISPHLSAELYILNRFYYLNLHVHFIFCSLMRVAAKVLIISYLD